jgi:hypothetical protein
MGLMELADATTLGSTHVEWVAVPASPKDEEFQRVRDMLVARVFVPDDVSPELVRAMRHQFQASINNANNSWRLPVFNNFEAVEIVLPDVDLDPKCECGAAKCGIGRGMAGHSGWCPWRNT